MEVKRPEIPDSLRMLFDKDIKEMIDNIVPDYHDEKGTCLVEHYVKCNSTESTCKYYKKDKMKKFFDFNKGDKNDCKYCINNQCFNEYIMFYTAVKYLQFIIEDDEIINEIEPGNTRNNESSIDDGKCYKLNPFLKRRYAL